MPRPLSEYQKFMSQHMKGFVGTAAQRKEHFSNGAKLWRARK